MATEPGPLEPTAPIVLNKSYNKLWITRISILAAKPGEEAAATIWMIPYIKETGEMAPEGMGFQVAIPNIFERIQGGDTELAAIFEGILTYASDEAKKQHLIQ